MIRIILYLLVLVSSNIFAATQAIPITELAEFNQYPEPVKKLIIKAEALSKQNLTYRYGSNNPKQGGMDCSGTINYLLSSVGVKDVPRQANEIYLWAEKNGHLYMVNGANMKPDALKSLKAGDLLFWKGTYAVHRTPPITHV